MSTGLARTQQFSEQSARAELLAKIQDVVHVPIKAEAMNGTPSVRLAGFAFLFQPVSILEMAKLQGFECREPRFQSVDVTADS
jgi:hypothetical protein